MAYFEPINEANLYYSPPRNDPTSGVTKEAVPGNMADPWVNQKLQATEKKISKS